MCDCYSRVCKCGKYYIPIHIGNFKYPRDIIKAVYCPECYEILRKKKYPPIRDVVSRSEDEEAGVSYCATFWEIRAYKGGKRIAIEFNQNHKCFDEKKGAAKYWDDQATFNGSPFPEKGETWKNKRVPDCKRFKCKNMAKVKFTPNRPKNSLLYKAFGNRSYWTWKCKKRNKEIRMLSSKESVDCKYCKPTSSRKGMVGKTLVVIKEDQLC